MTSTGETRPRVHGRDVATLFCRDRERAPDLGDVDVIAGGDRQRAAPAVQARDRGIRRQLRVRHRPVGDLARRHGGVFQLLRRNRRIDELRIRHGRISELRARHALVSQFRRRDGQVCELCSRHGRIFQLRGRHALVREHERDGARLTASRQAVAGDHRSDVPNVGNRKGDRRTGRRDDYVATAGERHIAAALVHRRNGGIRGELGARNGFVGELVRRDALVGERQRDVAGLPTTRESASGRHGRDVATSCRRNRDGGTVFLDAHVAAGFQGQRTAPIIDARHRGTGCEFSDRHGACGQLLGGHRAIRQFRFVDRAVGQPQKDVAAVTASGKALSSQHRRNVSASVSVSTHGRDGDDSVFLDDTDVASGGEGDGATLLVQTDDGGVRGKLLTCDGAIRQLAVRYGTVGKLRLRNGGGGEFRADDGPINQFSARYRRIGNRIRVNRLIVYGIGETGA